MTEMDASVAHEATPGRQMGAPVRGLVIALTIGIGGLSLVETIGALTAGQRVATEAEWQAAAAEVRAGFRPGDLVVFAPAWSDQVGRYYLGDLVTPQMAARPDANGYSRIWEVSIRGARDKETEAAGVTEQHETRHGRVRVGLYVRAHVVRPGYDFTAHFAEATAFERAADGAPERPCARDGAALVCTGARVERRILEMDYQPRQGILAPANGRLHSRLCWEEVPLEDALTGYTGVHDYYARKSADGPIDFRVFIGEEQVYARTVTNADGWRPFSIDTAAQHQRTPRASVCFEWSSTQPAWRNLGFHAETSAGAP